MTKRPLLFGVMAFVFGELAGISIYMTMGLGMVTLLLLLWSIRDRRSRNRTMPVFAPFFCICILLGILNGYRCRIPDSFREEIGEAVLAGDVSCMAEGRIRRIENREEKRVLLIQTTYMEMRGNALEGGQVEKISSSRQSYVIQIYETCQEDCGVLPIGSLVCCEFDIRVPEEPSNPGEFNGKSYYQAKGIDFLGFAREVRIVRYRHTGILQWITRLQEQERQIFYEGMSEENAGLMSAMLLGTGWDLESGIRRLFQKSGIAHILAISALHISIIGGSCYRFLRKIGCSYTGAGIPVMVLLLLYGWMTGFSGSTIRAVVMFLLMLWGDILGRTYDMLTAMGAACLLMLLENPHRLWDAGFLLSFSAVFALGGIVPIVQGQMKNWKKTARTRREKVKALQMLLHVLPEPVRAWLNRISGEPDMIKHYLGEGLLSGLILQAVTAPIVVYYYYDFPVYGIFLNLIVIPLMTLLLICGCCGLLAYPVLPWLGKAFLLPCEWILNLFQVLCKGAECLPGAVWHIGAVSLWEIGIYYGMLLFLLLLFYKGKRSKAIFLSVLLLLCILFRADGKLRVIMLDVGQGDSILVKTPDGHSMLFDGGSSSRSSIGEYVLTPALKYYGCGCLDYIFVSHMDQDHVNGIMECIALSQQGGIPIRHLAVPALAETDPEFCLLLEQAEQAGIQIIYMRPGSQLLLDRVVVTCLYPAAPSLMAEAEEKAEDTASGRNDQSMVLSVSYLEFRMLFTGDLEQRGEACLLREYGGWLQGGYAVLKTGHHGASGSSSMPFLETVQADLALISCGRQNPYGHPHAETLERLESSGCQVFCTKETGAIEIVTDGKRMKVHFFNAQDAGL